MKNPLTAIPGRYRFALYVVYGVGSVVLTDLATRGVVPTNVVEAWTGVGALLGLTAASNVAAAPAQPQVHVHVSAPDPAEVAKAVQAAVNAAPPAPPAA